jgi:hypothetical protein
MMIDPSKYAEVTRHARRLYIGGIPPNYVSDDELRDFLNVVISTGLGESNDHSYIVSIYADTKKWFAFVELKSVELTTACLDLDGIVYKKIILKVLRANEYNAALLPPAMLERTLVLDLRAFPFGFAGSPSFAQYVPEFPETDLRMASLIQFSILRKVKKNSIVIIGFPFDDIKLVTRGSGCGSAPECLRYSIRQFKAGYVRNAEYGIDMTDMKICDVGDIPAGKSVEETKQSLTAAIIEVITREAIPFVVGGTNDMSFFNFQGMLRAFGSNIGVIKVSTQIDARLLDDAVFCPPTNNAGTTFSCDGRYIQFGAQVFFFFYLI